MKYVSIKNTLIPFLLTVLLLVAFNLTLYQGIGVRRDLSRIIYIDGESPPMRDVTGDISQISQLISIPIDNFADVIISQLPITLSRNTQFIFETDIRFDDNSGGAGLLLDQTSRLLTQLAAIVYLDVDEQALMVEKPTESGEWESESIPLPRIELKADEWYRLAIVVDASDDEFELFINNQLVASEIQLLTDVLAAGIFSTSPATEHDNTNLQLLVAEGCDSKLVRMTRDASRTAVTVLFDDSWGLWGGDWQIVSDSQIVQSDTTVTDVTALYPVEQPITAVNVMLQHLEGLGGGVMFNAQRDADSRAGHMVRYFPAGDNGRNVIGWGYFGAAGYQGQGNRLVPPARQFAHLLRILLDDNQYHIQLNQRLIECNIPLIYDEGWSGLVTTQSNVIFSDFQWSG